MAVQAQQYSENMGFSLCGSQDWMDIGNGFFDFSLSLQQQQQQEQMHQQLQIHQQGNQNLVFDNSQVVSSSMAFSQSLAIQAEKQRQEIDRIIWLQNERLRTALQGQRKQQFAMLLRRFESKTLNLLRQRDEDIAKAAKKTLELEDCLRRVEMESQAWQRIANENEAMAITLNNTLEQVKENFCCFSSGAAEDAESCCDSSSHAFNREGNREEKGTREENRYETEQQMNKLACKGCNSRSSCVLFLPCRHLCTCKSCEAFFDSCPVCKSVKKASIEIFLF